MGIFGTSTFLSILITESAIAFCAVKIARKAIVAGNKRDFITGLLNKVNVVGSELPFTYFIGLATVFYAG
ncbi:hypothetical protein NSMS1_02210 [Nostoc sp. MS1]|nr:hypothetical protein NSMS1_02210 [Nostoc sp. MS1]